MLLRHNYPCTGSAGCRNSQPSNSRNTAHYTVVKKRYKVAEVTAYKKIRGNVYEREESPGERRGVDKSRYMAARYSRVDIAKDVESARLFKQVEKIMNVNHDVNKTFRPMYRNNVMGCRTREIDYNPKIEKVNLTTAELTHIDLNYMRGLGNYKIEQEIGRGAYSTVRSAVQKSTGRRVAVKIYDKSKLSDNQKNNCVSKEARILQELNHANIVKLYEMIEMPNELFLIMELVKGRSLYSYIQSRPAKRLTESECMRIFLQIAAGVDYCHSRNVVHRDLKLTNVLVDDHQGAKIIDFGFSVVAASSQRLRAYCGTPAYMAPEVLMKESYCGKPADIWSLGVLLFAMLCGTCPFAGKSEKELVVAVAKGRYSFPVAVSEEVKELIGNMLCVEPQRRISAEQVHKRVEDMVKQTKSMNAIAHLASGYVAGNFDRLARIRYGY